jgi:prepilin-type N-terminal cleavage/methylation domain-containing protein
MSVRVCHSAFRNPNSAFTLVELLIVISIIAILSAMLLGVAATSAEQARGSRSKSMIAKINGLVMQQYDTYKDRRAPVNDANPALRNLKGVDRAKARLYALRELMLMEIPDRWSDVLLNSVENVSQPSDLGQPRYLAASGGSTFGGPTPIIETYRRQFFAMKNAGVSNETILENQGAECLYLFVMHATSDGEARGLFNESSIGDTDGDGAYEFLDGWGNPIGFIRWPAGYESSKQVNARMWSTDLNDTNWIQQAAVDHDPFDVFRVDANAFRTMPLIYSMGADERSSLYRAEETVVWPRGGVGTALRPYALVNSSEAGDQYLGSPMNDDGSAVDPRAGTDNITNHNLTGE